MATTSNTSPQTFPKSDVISDQKLSPPDECLTEDQRREKFMELLFEAGLIRERKPKDRPMRERPPLIHVEGEPLSETIIKERR